MTFFFLNILLFFVFFSLANEDSAKYVFLFKKKENQIFLYNDTNLFLIHQYKQNFQNFYSYGGISFTPSVSLFIDDIREPFWTNSIDLYYLNVVNKYCRAYKPYTSIFFVTNFVKLYNEEYIKAIHSQNFLPNLNLYFEGMYNNQKNTVPLHETSSNYIYLSSNFDKSRIKAYSYFLRANFKVKEIGGVQNIADLFENNLPIQNSLIFLTNASNYWATSKFFSEFTYILLNKDSSLNIIPVLRLEYDKRKKIYNDLPSDFYLNIFIDSTKTYDSLSFLKFNNSIGFIFSHKINLSLKFGHKYYSFFDNLKNFNGSSNYLNLSLINNLSSITNFVFDFIYYLNGYYKKSYSLNILVSKKIFSKEFILTINNEIFPNDYFFQNLCVNNYCFQKNLGKKIINAIEVKVKNDSLDFNFNLFFKFFKNFAVLNGYPLPININLGTIGAYIERFYCFKNFKLYKKLLLQKSTNNIIDVPLLCAFSSLYYENMLFKKSLKFQVGIDLSYFTSFYSPIYIPSLGYFAYEQIRKIGNYPLINLFFDFNVKRANIFFLIEHLNYRLINGEASFLSFYPLQNRMLKFGVNWRFYN